MLDDFKDIPRVTYTILYHEKEKKEKEIIFTEFLISPLLAYNNILNPIFIWFRASQQLQ